jgi:glutaminyl-peptide cyclotransferase
LNLKKYLFGLFEGDLTHLCRIDDCIGLTELFFDGEEAFKTFSNTDGLYGSKHLAELWDNTTYITDEDGMTTQLNRIKLFVLLDLIGAPAPTFRSTSVSTC